MKISTFLDPRFKELEWVPDDEKEYYHDAVLHETVKLVGKTFDPAPAGAAEAEAETTSNLYSQYTQTQTQSKKMTINSFFKPIAKKAKTQISNNNVALVKSEISRYLQEPQILNKENQVDWQVNPIEWWKLRAVIYPNLSKTVKHFFCVPATSVPSERIFSTAGHIVNKKRSRLTSENVDMLLFLNKNRRIIPNVL